jgi:hypothetical protein
MFKFFKNMSQIIINNTSFSGRNVTIINGKVIIDGKDVTPDAKEINISITGDINNLEVDYAQKIDIKGNVNSLHSGTGNVICQNTGNIQTGSGDVECNDVNGNIQTGSGDVNANNIGGSVRTGSGDIKYKK